MSTDNIASLRWDFDAHFVGYNDEAAVSNLFAKRFTFSKRLLLLYQPLMS